VLQAKRTKIVIRANKVVGVVQNPPQEYAENGQKVRGTDFG